MLVFSEDEINQMTLPEVKKALKKFEKENELDAPLIHRPDLCRNTDQVVNCLLALEDRILALELGEAIDTPLGSFDNCRAAAEAHGQTEGWVYYRLKTEPELYRKRTT